MINGIKHEYDTYQPFAQITLCDPKAEKVFRLLEDEFGFKCISVTRRDNPRYKMQYRWSLQSQRACDFARLLEPYLIIKKERAQIMMQWMKRRGGSFTEKQMQKQIDMGKYQNSLYNEMKRLNHLGAL